jgi:hypothetical protein
MRRKKHSARIIFIKYYFGDQMKDGEMAEAFCKDDKNV